MEEYAVGSQKILTTAEVQFMNAYDGHMKHVYKEMNQLRLKADRNISVNMKHQMLHKMNTRAEWFQKEALELS